jgi:hypothetical protein
MTEERDEPNDAPSDVVTSGMDAMTMARLAYRLQALCAWVRRVRARDAEDDADERTARPPADA